MDYKIRLCRVPLEFYGVTIKPTLRQLLWVTYRALSKTGWYFQLSVLQVALLSSVGTLGSKSPLELRVLAEL